MIDLICRYDFKAISFLKLYNRFELYKDKFVLLIKNDSLTVDRVLAFEDLAIITDKLFGQITLFPFSPLWNELLLLTCLARISV